MEFIVMMKRLVIMSDIKFDELEKGDIVYWVRILKDIEDFKIYKMKLRTVESTYCVGVDSTTKFAKDFSPKDIEENVFKDIKLAQEYLKEKKKERKKR